MPPGTVMSRGDRIVRAESYSALASLLHGPDSITVAVIRELQSVAYATESATSDWPSRIDGIGSDALCAMQGDAGRAALETEWARLFGETEFRPLTNELSPCETIYVAESAGEHQQELIARYESIGFPYREALTSHCDCPGHVSVEFAFMAHALRLADAGDVVADETSTVFVANHILRWIPLFAVVLRRKTAHPVMEFAALATERFMCAEAVLAGIRRK